MFDFDETPEWHECTECGGPGILLGSLGRSEWFRCRDCGHDFCPDEYEADLEVA